MVDVALLFGKFVLLGMLYLFLFAAVRTGLGLVAAGGPSKAPGAVGVRVVSGPEEIVGVRVPVEGALTIGRAPDAGLIVADEFVSTHHARLTASRDGILAEDLGSTNGTNLNGRPLSRPTRVKSGDVLQMGTVKLRIERL